MTEIEGIKQVLGKMVEAVELIADETAELVDKYQRTQYAEEYWQDVVDRSNALVAVAQSLRLAAETVLDKTYLPARIEGQA